MKYVLLPLSFALAGCVANDLTLTIDHYVFDDPMAACVVSPASGTVQASGLLDVGILSNTGVPGYTVFPVVTNHLPLPSNQSNDVNRRSITFKGVNVELKPDANIAPAIPPAQRKFFVPLGAGRLEAGASIALGVEVIPRAVGLEMAGAVATGTGAVRPRVVVSISPVGDFSGDTVVGAPVDFPVDICNFCLSGTPMACPTLGFPATQIQVGGCISSQDLPVTCCTDSQAQLLCGAQVPVKT